MKGEWYVSSLNDGSGTQYMSSPTAGWVTQISGFTATPYVYIYANNGPNGSLDNVVLNRSAPEPATMLLFGVGLAGVGMRRRYRHQTR